MNIVKTTEIDGRRIFEIEIDDSENYIIEQLKQEMAEMQKQYPGTPAERFSNEN